MGFLAAWKKSKSASKDKPTFHSQYVLGKKLGEGGFATVYSCKSKIEPQEAYAVKIADMTSVNCARKDFQLEVQIMKQIGAHPSCVQIHEAFEDRRFGYLVMEKCSCTIVDAFLTKDFATERELAQTCRSLLQAIDHLHSLRIVHRDIKPCNLLLKDGQRGDHLDVRLCDFGLAAMLPQEGLKRCGCIPVRSGLTEICGTTPYMSPEMLLQKRPYNELVDEWSCGVTMYTLLFGEFPFKTTRKDLDLMKEIISLGKNQPSFKPRSCFPKPSEKACDLVSALLTRDPEARVTAADALTYPFIELCLPKPSKTGISDKSVVLPIVPDESECEPLPSFHPTLLHAKTVVQEYEECTPLENKAEEALAALQKEKGQQWQRDPSRCSTEPSMKAQFELQRLSARHSTHSGLMIRAEKEHELKEFDIILPGTPSTTDSDSES